MRAAALALALGCAAEPPDSIDAATGGRAGAPLAAGGSVSNAGAGGSTPAGGAPSAGGSAGMGGSAGVSIGSGGASGTGGAAGESGAAGAAGAEPQPQPFTCANAPGDVWSDWIVLDMGAGDCAYVGDDDDATGLGVEYDADATGCEPEFTDTFKVWFGVRSLALRVTVTGGNVYHGRAEGGICYDGAPVVMRY